MTAGGVIVTPAPTAREAAAIAAAVQAVLDEETSATHDPLPAAYRSAWRRTALAEGTAPHDNDASWRSGV